MCMKMFDPEKLFFWQTNMVFYLAIFPWLHLVIDSVHIMESTSLRAFIGSLQHFEDILQTY